MSMLVITANHLSGGRVRRERRLLDVAGAASQKYVFFASAVFRPMLHIITNDCSNIPVNWVSKDNSEQIHLAVYSMGHRFIQQHGRRAKAVRSGRVKLFARS